MCLYVLVCVSHRRLPMCIGQDAVNSDLALLE